MNDVQPIDMDLIHKLRREGNSWAARLILENYYANLKANKEQLKKELKSQEYLKTKVRKICTVCRKEKAEEGRTRCKTCREYFAKWKKRKV